MINSLVVDLPALDIKAKTSLRTKVIINPLECLHLYEY